MDDRSDGVHAEPVDETRPDDHPTTDLENVTSYDDGDRVVVCDRKNAQAWIRSDTVIDLDA